MERGRKEEGEDFLSGNTRASSSNPRIYATLAGILRDCKDEGERERGWLKRKKEGKEEIPSTMIYSTVFLTSITWPNNCRFIEDLLKKKKWLNDLFSCFGLLLNRNGISAGLFIARVREMLFRGMIEWLRDGNEMMWMKWFIVSLFSIYFLYDEWFGNKIRSIIILNVEKFDNTMNKQMNYNYKFEWFLKYEDIFNLLRLKE